MQSRVVGRAAALGVALVLGVTTVAVADTVNADGDALMAGQQGSVNLGTVAPGATVELDVSFVLACKGTSHVPRGTTISVAPDFWIAPEDGTASVSAGAIGPVPGDWPAFGTTCPDTDVPSLAGGTPAHLVLTAPTVPGTGHEFTFLFALDPTDGVTNTVAFSAVMDVAGSPDPDPAPDPDPDPGSDPPPAVDWTVAWAPPLSDGSPALVANRGRVVPLRARLFADGVEVDGSDGAPPVLQAAHLDTCGSGGQATETMTLGPMHWSDDGWAFRLETRPMATGCWQLSLDADGDPAGGVLVWLSDGRVGLAQPS